MRIRLPSLGFLYLLAVLIAVVWLFAYLARTPWYEKTGREKDMGWAHYLERLAPRADVVRRKEWLGTGLGLYLQYEDWDAVVRVLQLHQQYHLDPKAQGISELSKDVWSMNLSEDKWTSGSQVARFLFYNPSDEPQSYALQWRTKGPGKAHCDVGDGEWRPFELVGDDWREAKVLVGPIPAKSSRVFRFKADTGFSLPGEERQLGLLLDRIEFDVKN